MTLGAALTIADSGLASVARGLSVISNNIAHADTPGFAAEQATQRALSVEDRGEGVLTGLDELASDPALQAQIFSQNADAAYAQTTQASLSALEPALGTVGAGDDLGSVLGALQTQFSDLLNDPSSVTAQSSVVNAAQSLATQIRSIAGSISQARQSAQDDAVAGVASLNTALHQIGTLSDQIVALKSQGESTADLEHQRNAVAATVSSLVGARFKETATGDLTVFTAFGTELPTRGGSAVSISAAQAGSGAYYPGGGLPGITLGGTDITSQFQTGSIGAAIALRDTRLPAFGASLDEFSQTLASRFAAQGLTLFTNQQGNVPAGGGTPPQSGYVGFSSEITVNPAVTANPALVRDGTDAIAGSTAGASAFTPNPSNQSGFSVLIQRVLNFALGAEAQSGVPQPSPAVSGLGPSGTLSAGFGAVSTLADFATAITGAQAAASADAEGNATDQSDVQTALTGQLQTATGVNMDSQLSLMVQLQNAYGANAKIVATVQSMFNTLLQSVQP